MASSSKQVWQDGSYHTESDASTVLLPDSLPTEPANTSVDSYNISSNIHAEDSLDTTPQQSAIPRPPCSLCWPNWLGCQLNHDVAHVALQSCHAATEEAIRVRGAELYRINNALQAPGINSLTRIELIESKDQAQTEFRLTVKAAESEARAIIHRVKADKEAALEVEGLEAADKGVA